MANSLAGESVLERAVRILAVFGPDNPVVTMTELAQRAGLPLSTTSRLVNDMVRLGLLRRDDSRRVRIGVRLWELGARASPTRDLRDAALPFMEDVHAVVGHHVQLGVREDSEVLFVERLSAPQSVVNVTRIAGRLPLHASSSGLVLLANAPVAIQDRILGGGLPGLTDRTITDPARLRAFLAEVRRTGVAFCPGFIHADAAGIAVPLRDPADRVVATLSVIVPNDDQAISKVPVLQAAARGVRRALARRAEPTGGFE